MLLLYTILAVLGLVHIAYIILAAIYPDKKSKSPNKEKYSIEHIVCFKNETNFVKEKLKNCYELEYPNLHHTFVNDNSTDATSELLEKHKQENTNLISNDANLGKNRSQIKSVKQTSSDLILFTDANVFLEKDALNHIVRAFDEDTGGVCGNVTTTIDMRHQDIVGKYWEIEKVVKRFQSLSGAVIGFDGGFYCVRMDYYNWSRSNELSDLETAFLILEQGKQTKYVSDAIATELEKRKLKASFMARIRASNRVFWSFRRIFKYIEKLKPSVILHFTIHKLIRYAFIILSVISLPFIIADLIGLSPFLLLIFAIPHVHRLIFESIALCVGGIIALTGKEYTSWSNQKT
ncbi:MAG: hypothetical protein DRI57_01025 [Deltaproteobacteria bacterium]|nr:MAG: hypothetical protein DRI57_01025 [Deltaproteobacteria bacterium]